MNSSSAKPNSISEYISSCSPSDRKLLKEMRAVIKKAAPKAEETIRYGMPTFWLNGNLVHFAAMKSHIGFYPAPSAIKAFKKELAKYQTSKGAIQFPKDESLPLGLVRRITIYRVKESQTYKKK